MITSVTWTATGVSASLGRQLGQQRPRGSRGAERPRGGRPGCVGASSASAAGSSGPAAERSGPPAPGRLRDGTAGLVEAAVGDTGPELVVGAAGCRVLQRRVGGADLLEALDPSGRAYGPGGGSWRAPGSGCRSRSGAQRARRRGRRSSRCSTTRGSGHGWSPSRHSAPSASRPLRSRSPAYESAWASIGAQEQTTLRSP